MNGCAAASPPAAAAADGLPAHAAVLLDVAGTALDAADRRRLAHPLTGGVVLFARNWASRCQVTALCADIKAVRPDAVIGVDCEGGRVQRFRGDGMTRLPAMRRLGALWAGDAPGASAAATAVGLVMGAELRACGVDLSFAPVLDLDHGQSGVVGDRSFGRDPQVVASLASSLIRGMALAGLSHCAKHFPGHGHAEADTHVDVAVDARDADTILADDAAPYIALHRDLKALMPAHVVYTSVDPVPAGYSRHWLQAVLRGRLGYLGAVVSDDLSMAGARRVGGRSLGAVEAAAAALAAGCDLAMLCNQSLQGDALDRFLDGLAAARAASHWRPDARSEARRLALLPSMPAMPWDAVDEDPRVQQARSVVAALTDA